MIDKKMCFRMAALYRLLTIVLAINIILSVIEFASANSLTKPNIILIVADDLGWDDVSFHGSEQALTPNVDLLAYTGVALGRHYSHCVCTPSRAALLTGKFAHTIGMHGYPLTNGEDRGLPLSEKLLPEYLKDLGYHTHLVGKWHLGQARDELLPTSRGFDSHFGYRGGVVDYYEYSNEESWSSGPVTGFDLYRNLTPAWDVEGYMTDVLTNEAKNIIQKHDKSTPLFLMLSHLAPHSGNDGALLQAPPETVRSMRHVHNYERRIFAAMMKKLDDSVGEIVRTLSENEVLNNSIILFISDNGGMPLGRSVNYASNWPLRGSKFTPFEGGIRTTALMWTPALASTNHLWNGYMHIVDWLPTLLGAIGADIPTAVDGINLWNDIKSNKASPRIEFFEIYTYGDTSFNSVTSGDYKLITGNITKEYSGHLGGNLRGISGDGPSYIEAIRKSDMYAIMEENGKPFKIEDFSLRNRIRIQNCNYDESSELRCTENDNFCLFNINDDPCESRDLSRSQPALAESLLARLQLEVGRKVDRPVPLYRDPRASPSLHNYTWTTWAHNIR